MAPSADPVFIASPRTPKRMAQITKSTSSEGPLIDYGEEISPPRGRGRQKDVVAFHHHASALREEFLRVLMPANTINVPEGCSPPVSSTIHAVQLVPEQQLFTMLPAEFDLPQQREQAIRTPANRFADEKQQLPTIVPGNVSSPILPLPQQETSQAQAPSNSMPPLRNRRVPASAGMHHHPPRRMTISTLPSLQSPFTSPLKPPPATLAVTAPAVPAYQVRNPYDLLEVIKSHPIETFTRIEGLGAENIRLTEEMNFLRNETKLTKDKMTVAQENQIQGMLAQVMTLTSIHWSKQNLLHACIERLENQICELKGGGRMMQGEWMSEGVYATVHERAKAAEKDASSQNGLGIRGENNWNELVTQGLATETEAQSPTLSNSSSGDGEGLKGKGKEKSGLRLDPNAQAFVPSVASSPGKSEVTDIFNTFPPSPRMATTMPPNAPTSISHGPASATTYVSFLQQNLQCNLSPIPTSPNCLFPKIRPSSAPTAKSATPSPPKSKKWAWKASSSTRPAPQQSIPDAVIDVIQRTLPPLFRQLCPFSVCGLQICPLNPCPMKKLCREYNDDRNQTQYFNQSAQSQGQNLMQNEDGGSGKGDGDAILCPNRNCKQIHEYATCAEDLTARRGKGSRCQRLSKKNKWHVKKRAHKDHASVEEWRIREAIAGLREAHREGRYL